MTPPNSRTVSRRTAIRTGLTAGTTAVLAGCTSGGDDSDPDSGAGSDGGGDSSGGGETDATVQFEDDFEDGDLRSAPAWETSSLTEDSETMSAQAVSLESPADGRVGVQLTDVTDDRYPSPSTFSLADPMAGMDGEWTLSGLFSPVQIPADVDERYFGVGFYWPFDSNFAGRGWLQFRFARVSEAADDPRIQLRTQSQDDRKWRVPAETTASPLELDRWYRWELAHDGDGGYVASRWPADGGRGDGAEIRADFAVPDSRVTFDLTALTSVTDDDGSAAIGAGEKPLTVHHDYVRRTGE